MQSTFSIQGSNIECTDNVKLLGITLYFKLNFDKHIFTLCKNAAHQINVLNRIGKHLPINCRKVIYQSFILSAFNFCPAIWNFCSEFNNKKFDKLNYIALRHVYTMIMAVPMRYYLPKMTLSHCSSIDRYW